MLYPSFPDHAHYITCICTGNKEHEEPTEENPPAQDRKNVEILMQAIDEMKKLGFNSLEEYLAYKDEQSLKGLKKNPIEM